VVNVRRNNAAKVDDDIEWTVADQDAQYGTIRNFKRLTAGQRRALVIASKLAASKYLRATGAKLVNDITTRICFAA
jgi:DNA repair exonuclease SbcCD ATPase subunit